MCNIIKLNKYQNPIYKGCLILSNTMLKKIWHLAASASIFGGALYAHIWWRTNNNLHEYQATQDAGTLKDASRLTNDSFGISWGFQADDIVMAKIDSGDFLFIKYDCSECLSVPEYFRCLSITSFKLDEEFDSVGYAYRNEEGLHILFSQFDQTKVVSYGHIVGLPYIRELMIQKNTDCGQNTHKKLKELLEDEKGKVKKMAKVGESPVQLANRMNEYLFSGAFGNVSDLRQLLRTEDQIHVRTETNRTLRSL